MKEIFTLDNMPKFWEAQPQILDGAAHSFPH